VVEQATRTRGSSLWETLLQQEDHFRLNPVRAGICDDPADWRWSSYKASTGLAKAPPLLALGELLGLFGVDPAVAVTSLRNLVGPTVA
jgi:putative transposase